MKLSMCSMFVIGAFVISGCESSGSDNDDANGNGGQNCDNASDVVDCTLQALGVDTTVTAREVAISENNNEPLPESYAPLGASRAIEKFDELYSLNMTLSNSDDNPIDLTEIVPGPMSYTNSNLFSPDSADTPWTGNDYIQASVAADVTGDGMDELIVVYKDTSRSDVSVMLVTIGHSENSHAISTPRIVSNLQPTDLVISAGDFNGDGLSEPVIGMMFNGSASFVTMTNDEGTLSSAGSPINYSSTTYNTVTIAFAIGNLDYDREHELGVVINEYETNYSFNNNDGVSRYYLYDDASTSFDLLDEGMGTVSLSDGARNLKGADIAIGDVDGDGVDEFIIGGLTDIGNECDIDAEYALKVLDDSPRGFATLRAHAEEYQAVSGACESGSSRKLTFMHVNTVDIDGNNIPEIQANELIYHNLVDSGSLTALTVRETLNKSELFWASSSSSSGTFSWRSSSMVAADLTSDNRQNIAYTSDSIFPSAIRIWGLNDSGTWGELHTIPVDNFDDRPQLMPANVDDDSIKVRFKEGTHKLVFTEPLVIAALAAAPCSADFGQTLEDCRTAFGKASSSSVSKENAWSVSASASVGFETDFSAFGVKVSGFELVATVERGLRSFTDNTYTITKRVVHTTGPAEDSVIFFTVPMDVYTYIVTSHWDPELIGSEIQVRLTREPITIMTDREFYNNNLDEGGFKIDEAVFSHTAGDPFSYPGTAERDGLLNLYDGIASDEVDVGQGTGFVTAEVSVYEEVTNGKTYSIDTTVEMRATVGVVVVGVSIGGGTDKTISYGQGEESSYEGSVAQIPASSFSENAYRFGLFSYIYDAPSSDQMFEVINYWVRPQI